MSVRGAAPSSVASRHLLPQGEKEDGVDFPSPLEGEGGSRRLTDEGSVDRTRHFAKQLRKNMTEAEEKLWSALRDRRFESFKFRRQVPIGKYIGDFVCHEKRLIVEVDGSQHEDSEYDRVRDNWLKSQHFRILRFRNHDIYVALDGTLLAILDALKKTPHPALRATFFRKGRRERKLA
jgi:very-short-patch-repair endonuclease